MRKRCTRTLSLLSVIVFIGLSPSTARPRRAAPNFGRRHRHVLLPELWVRLAASPSRRKPSRIQRLTLFFHAPQPMANRMQIRLCCRNADQDRDA